MVLRRQQAGAAGVEAPSEVVAAGRGDVQGMAVGEPVDGRLAGLVGRELRVVAAGGEELPDAGNGLPVDPASDALFATALRAGFGAS